MKTAMTSVFLAIRTTFGPTNIIRNRTISKIARIRHRTSCQTTSDCDEGKNHKIVTQAYPKHQTMTGDLSAVHEVFPMTNTGNDNKQNSINQDFGAERGIVP